MDNIEENEHQDENTNENEIALVGMSIVFNSGKQINIATSVEHAEGLMGQYNKSLAEDYIVTLTNYDLENKRVSQVQVKLSNVDAIVVLTSDTIS